MSNKKTRLCVVFFPPFDSYLGRRPHGVLMARVNVASALEMKQVCARCTPHQQLVKAWGVGEFFVGLETGYDADRPASDYKNLVRWHGQEKSGHYLDFIESLVTPLFRVGDRQAA